MAICKHYTLPAVVMCVYLFVFILLLSFLLMKSFQASSNYCFFLIADLFIFWLPSLRVSLSNFDNSRAQQSKVFQFFFKCFFVCHLHDVLLPSIYSYLCRLLFFCFVDIPGAHPDFYKLP